MRTSSARRKVWDIQTRDLVATLDTLLSPTGFLAHGLPTSAEVKGSLRIRSPELPVPVVIPVLVLAIESFNGEEVMILRAADRRVVLSELMRAGQVQQRAAA